MGGRPVRKLQAGAPNLEFKVEYRSKTRKSRLPNPNENPDIGGDYWGFKAADEPPGWKVVGAGAWKSGGHPLPLQYNYMGNDVTTWIPVAKKPDEITGFTLSVVLMKVE